MVRDEENEVSDYGFVVNALLRVYPIDKKELLRVAVDAENEVVEELLRDLLKQEDV